MYLPFQKSLTFSCELHVMGTGIIHPQIGDLSFFPFSLFFLLRLLMYFIVNKLLTVTWIMNLTKIHWSLGLFVKRLVTQIQFEKKFNDLYIIKTGSPMQSCSLELVGGVDIDSLRW